MYEQAFLEGRTFEQFLAAAVANRELWHAMATRAKVAPAAVERARQLPGRWRVLAIADDWCGDAVNILPVVVKLVEDAGTVDLRIVGREAWPELMARHLTGSSRSVPVFIVLDESGECRGWWGPRPADLQVWFEAEGRPLPKEERYRELRRRYARDRGTAIALEIVDLIACAAAPAGQNCGSARSCGARKAA